MLKKVSSVFASLVLFLVFTVPSSFADEVRLPGSSEPIIAPRGIRTGGLATFQEIIKVGITMLFIVSFLLALVFLIWGGINWITSGGEKEGIEKARKKITFAIIGLVVVLIAFFIVNFVSGFFAIKLLDISI